MHTRNVRASSGTLREMLHSARAAEWLKITGATDTSSAACIVSSLTCEMSTSMPAAQAPQCVTEHVRCANTTAHQCDSFPAQPAPPPLSQSDSVTYSATSATDARAAHLPPERVQPSPLRRYGARVRPGRVARMRKGHIPVRRRPRMQRGLARARRSVSDILSPCSRVVQLSQRAQR